MKTTGITRRIDELGRIVIPMEIRKNLNIEIRELLEILQVGDKIEISKRKDIRVCYNCGKTLEETYKYCPHCGKEQI
jgi:transcriptional pleiotropic regulator of transition state genes